MDWNRIVTEIGPRLFRYLRASFPPSIASELVQEVLIRLVRKYENGNYDPKKGSLCMFAYGIAHYVRLEALRAIPPEISFYDSTEFEYQIGPTVYQEGLNGSHRKEVLRQAIAQLTDIQRDIILLHIDEELTLTDISRILNCPIGTIKSHVHRAKKRLRELLLGKGEA